MSDAYAMNPGYLSAVAALAGSAIGGMTSLVSTWFAQKRQDRTKRFLEDKTRRQKLYKQFIDEASKLYADALVHDKVEVAGLFSVYALISQMRVFSSSTVVEEAGAIARMIVETYFAPNRTLPELRELISSHAIDPLRAFSEKCRQELSGHQSAPALGSTRRAAVLAIDAIERHEPRHQ